MPIINNKILNGRKIQDIISSLTLCEQKNRCKAFKYRPSELLTGEASSLPESL